MTRSGLFFSLIFAFAPLFHAAAEGLTRLDPGLYAISTAIEAFDLVCAFPEGLLSGTGSLAVDPTRPTEFLQRFTLRSPGPVASQRVTIRGRLVGACLPEDLAAGP